MSQLNIVPLKTERHAVVETVVDVLRIALKRAKRGEIISVGIAYVASDGAIGDYRSSSDDVGRMLGAVTLLQHRLAAQCGD